jgi:drug/metabolite transporter (DMT)-like permease
MKYATGAAMVLAAGLVWSVQGMLIRSIHEAESWAVLFWRSAGMIPVLTLWIGVQSRGRILQSLRDSGLPGVLGGFGLVMAFSGAIYALQATTVANAMLLFTASPFFAAILGRVLLGEAVSVVTWLAIALAVLGVGVMVGGGMAGGAMEGNVAALISALGFAFFTVMLRWPSGNEMLPTVLLGGLFSLLTGAILCVTLPQPLIVPVTDAAIAAAMGAVTLTGGMVLYTLGSRVVPAAQGTLLSLIEVLLGPLWVWLFLGETISLGTLIGGAVLLGAVLLNAWGCRNPA